MVKAGTEYLRLLAASRFSHKSVESVRALRGASGEASRNEGASPRENERLHLFSVPVQSLVFSRAVALVPRPSPCAHALD